MGRETDELARAVDAFERAGDPERAAEAAVAASWHTWHSNPVESGAWLERATALLDGRPPSRAKALMLAERARIVMVNYQYETSLPIAEEAIQQARAVGDVQIEADAMVTSACSTAMVGDHQRSMELFEQALALVGHRGRVASRANTNLGVAWSFFGDLQRAAEVSARGIAMAERDGDEQSAAFMRGNLMGVQFERGEWDDALTHANVILEAGSPRLRPFAHAIRAQILQSRGRSLDALSAMEAGIAESLEIADPQVVWPTLITSAGLFRRQGRSEDAAGVLTDVVDAMGNSESVGDVQEWHVDLAVELREAGRNDAGQAIVARIPDGGVERRLCRGCRRRLRRGRGHRRDRGEQATPGGASVVGRKVACRCRPAGGSGGAARSRACLLPEGRRDGIPGGSRRDRRGRELTSA